MTATSEVQSVLSQQSAPSEETNPTTRTARLAAGLAVLTLAAGCGLFGGGDGGDKGAAGPGGGAGKTTGATATAVPKPKAGGPFTSAQLGGASRVRLPKLQPAYRPTHGAYGTLQVAAAAIDPQDLGSGVKISPSRCKDAIWAGPSKRAFAKSPAAFQQFQQPQANNREGRGLVVWNILIDSAGKDPKTGLGRQPRGCATVRAGAEGRTTTLKAQRAPKLGTPARAVIFTGDGSPRTWIVSYAGNGYVGSVMVQGPAKAAQVEAIVTSVYRQTRQVLG